MTAMIRRRIAALLLAAAAGLVIGLSGGRPVRAELPVVQAPADAPRKSPEAGQPDEGDDESADDSAAAALARRIAARRTSQDRKSARQTKKVEDLEKLLQAVADPKQPINLKWQDQVRQVGDVQYLSLEQQEAAVPRLLEMLKDETPLPYLLVLPKTGVMQVRHRANAALSCLAQACLGRFPIRHPEDKLSAAQLQADREISQKLVDRWRQWWEEVKDLDLEERAEVASRFRNEVLSLGDEDLVEKNLAFASAAQDVSALEVLGPWLDRAAPARAAFFEQVIRTYCKLCEQKDAPRAARVKLLEALKRFNTREVGQQHEWAMVIGQTLSNITGRAMQLTYERIDESSGVQLVQDKCIEAWQEAFKKQSETPPSSKGRAAQDDGRPAEAARPAESR